MAIAALAACNRGGGDESADGEKAAGAFSVERGEWEMTAEITDVSLEGFPERMREQVREMEREARTETTCVPMDFSVDSFQLKNMRFSMDRRGSCNIAEITAQNGELRARVNCTGLPEDMSLSSEVDGEYDENSYSMNFRAEVDIEGQDRRGTVEGRVRGRRVGDCESEIGSGRSPPPPMMDNGMGGGMGGGVGTAPYGNTTTPYSGNTATPYYGNGM
jgi:hypothetical protein